MQPFEIIYFYVLMFTDILCLLEVSHTSHNEGRYVNVVLGLQIEHPDEETLPNCFPIADKTGSLVCQT